MFLTCKVVSIDINILKGQNMFPKAQKKSFYSVKSHI